MKKQRQASAPKPKAPPPFVVDPPSIQAQTLAATSTAAHAPLRHRYGLEKNSRQNHYSATSTTKIPPVPRRQIAGPSLQSQQADHRRIFNTHANLWTVAA